jgi:S1-C subfamily serine protease
VILNFLYKIRVNKLVSILLCFGLISCATAEEIRNRYNKLHVENLRDAEKVFVTGFNDLNHLPIPIQFVGKNPSYLKCDENRWNLLHQAPPEIRMACAYILKPENLIDIVKKYINTPYQIGGSQVYPAKKYSNNHEMVVEVIVDNHSRNFTLFTLSTNVSTTVILRSKSDGFEVRGSGAKAINDVNLGTRLSSERYSRVAYLLALNGALLKSIGNAYSKLPKHIDRYLVAGKGNEVPDSKTNPQASSGSGFFVSKKGHVITNQHVVSNCKKVTIGDNSKKQVTADILETDKRNDLALLKTSSLKMASVETKSLIRKLGITLVPLASNGLMRSEDVELGEKVLVAGYPYGEMFSNSIKVTGGMVSANRGLGDDIGQFQIDAAVQPGNSGGPIYDENGNIVGVVVSQLNKMKFAKATGSMPENVNFGIKASTVRQFLNASGLPTKWSKRSKRMNTRELAKIAKNQTVMVMCHR